MDRKFELIEYKIPKINMDFEKLDDGPCRINVNTSINVMLPNDSLDKPWIVNIKANFTNDAQEQVLCVNIKGYVKVFENTMSDEEQGFLIRNHIVPVVYERLRGSIDDLLHTTKINFMNLPPYEEVVS